MIGDALLQESGGGKIPPETRDLQIGLAARGIPTRLFTEKQIVRRRLPLARKTLVAGSIPVVLAALRQLDVAIPEIDDYPDCLKGYLHREIWESTVEAVVSSFCEGRSGALFVKPKGRLKRFTGHVITTANDLFHLEGASKRQAVYCSKVVEWKSEHRAYVVRGKLLGTRPYWADRTVEPDAGVIREAIATLEASGLAPAGYGIDFGVLATGETALIELNDGFGLGSYDLEPAAYTDLIVARWEELVQAPAMK